MRMDLIPIFNLMNTSNPDELSMSLPLALDNRIDAVGYGTPAAVPKRSRITRHQDVLR